MPVRDGLIFLDRVSDRAPQSIGAVELSHFAPTTIAKPFDAPMAGAGSLAIFKELGHVRDVSVTLFRLAWSDDNATPLVERACNTQAFHKI
jgi:hypothetical protein